jgi:hypothetical protein
MVAGKAQNEKLAEDLNARCAREMEACQTELAKAKRGRSKEAIRARMLGGEMLLSPPLCLHVPSLLLRMPQQPSLHLVKVQQMPHATNATSTPHANTRSGHAGDGSATAPFAWPTQRREGTR